jgi:glycosyltransferase involved in cell wall biosynthesis
MKPIRILVDSFADAELTNPQMTTARNIVRRLDPERFHVGIFCVREPDPLIVKRKNLRLIHLPLQRKTPRIFREFVLGKHDMLFYIKSSPASKWYLRLRKTWGDRRPVIGTVETQSNLREEPTVAPEAVDLWEKTILRSDYLFSNAESVRDSLKRIYQRSSGIVPLGVDTKIFTPVERTANARVRVLFVASLRPFKEPQTVIEAAARMPEVDFVLVGQGVMEEELKERVQREGLHNVRLTGAIGREALLEQVRAADILLHPSHWEGAPQVVLEASSCALPVIVRRDYQPATVIDGKTGYIVASTDEMFVRLRELVGCPDLRFRLGQAGREHAKRFDWDVITRQWAGIFEGIAQGCSRQELYANPEIR